MVVKSSGFDLRAASSLAVFDSGTAVAGFGDGTVAVTRLEDAGVPIMKTRPPGNSQGASVSGMAVVDSDNLCYGCTMDGSVILMQLNDSSQAELNQKEFWASVGCSRGVWDLSLGAGLIGLAGEDGQVTVLEKETMEVVGQLPGHKGACRGVDVNENGVVVSCGRDTTIRVWDVRAGESEVAVLTGHLGWVHSVAMVDHTIASGSGDKTVRLWDTRKPSESRVLEGHEFRVWGVALTSKTVYSCSSDETVRCWETDTGDCLEVLNPGSREGVVSVAVSSAGEYVCGGCEDGYVQLWKRPGERPAPQGSTTVEKTDQFPDRSPKASKPHSEMEVGHQAIDPLDLLSRLTALNKRLDRLLADHAKT